MPDAIKHRLLFSCLVMMRKLPMLVFLQFVSPTAIAQIEPSQVVTNESNTGKELLALVGQCRRTYEEKSWADATGIQIRLIESVRTYSENMIIGFRDHGKKSIAHESSTLNVAKLDSSGLIIVAKKPAEVTATSVDEHFKRILEIRSSLRDFCCSQERVIAEETLSRLGSSEGQKEPKEFVDSDWQQILSQHRELISAIQLFLVESDPQCLVMHCRSERFIALRDQRSDIIPLNEQNILPSDFHRAFFSEEDAIRVFRIKFRHRVFSKEDDRSISFTALLEQSESFE
jgi:hypothetical protein